MSSSTQVNPRSYKSILMALKSGQYKSRGELMRAVVDAYRRPYTHKDMQAPIPQTEELQGSELTENLNSEDIEVIPTSPKEEPETAVVTPKVMEVQKPSTIQKGLKR